MDLLAPVKAFDRFQRRHAWLGIPIAVQRNFSDQRAGTWAVQIAYFGFFSLFPLLLVFVSILGFVLQNHPGARASIVHSALSQFPIVGADPKSLTGSGVGLSIGLIGTLWSGLGVTLAVRTAFDWVYAIGPRSQPNFIGSRLRSLGLLAVAGTLQIVSTVVAAAVSGGIGKGPLVTIVGLVIALLINIVLFFAVFRFMVPSLVPTAELWPGILLAAVGWEVLQAVGGLYVTHVVKGASEEYGTFATVIGLLAWLYLGARLLVYSAEINVVLTRHLWPRSIMDPPEPADHRARAALAKMEERDDRETVDVTFHPHDRRAAADPRHPRFRVADTPPGGYGETDDGTEKGAPAGAPPTRPAAADGASRPSWPRRIVDALEVLTLLGFAGVRKLIAALERRRAAGR